MPKNYVKLRRNNRIDFLNPTADQVDIDDIAYHLARTCRYNGHMHEWYSNAEHSLLGSRLAKTPLVAKYFLLHDAAEYVFGDLASPVAAKFNDYRVLRDNFQGFIWRLFIGSDEPPKEVKEIDLRLTASEMFYLRGNDVEDLTAEPYPVGTVKFHCWNWSVAYAAFMSEFHNLFGVK